MQLNPYLFFEGQCEEAFKFYEQCLGGKIAMTVRYGESPEPDSVPPDWRDKVMHVSLVIGGKVLMGSDAPPGRQQKKGGFSVSFAVDDVAQAERIFNALSEKASVHMPMQKTFWAARFGMLVDRFGTPWMISCEQAK